MIITAENIVHYLTDKNIISPESVVDGDFTVVDMTRRNRNFKILRKTGTGYFVKQVKQYDPQSLNSLTREAQSYWLAKNDAGFKGIQDLMPRLIHYDPPNHILIVELFAGYENLSEMHLRLGHFPVSIAATLGTALGIYHKDVNRNMDEVNAKKIFPATLPWLLTINAPYIEQAKNTDANHRQFFTIIEQYPEFLAAIEQLRTGWQINSLIHGDMKWENCIVYNDVLKIIDWELADLGDAAWDVGAIFQTWLTHWVSQQNGQHQNNKPEDLQPAIAAFWNAYSGTMLPGKSDQSALLEKCCKCAAIRIIQTVFEYMHFTKKLDKTAIVLLQLSLNMLKNPAEATSTLLGL